MKPTLDIEMMRKLYDFGEMLVYEVEYCDRLTMTVRVDLRTFNSEFRPLRRDSLCPSGAALVSTMPALRVNLNRLVAKWMNHEL